MIPLIILAGFVIYLLIRLWKIMFKNLTNPLEKPGKVLVFIIIVYACVAVGLSLILLISMNVKIPKTDLITQRQIISKNNNSWYTHNDSTYTFYVFEQGKTIPKTVNTPVKEISWDKKYAMFVVSRKVYKNKFWYLIIPNVKKESQEIFTPKE